ncbi:hypothetical protein OG453_17020 [Streptomyces sp. NBC_01381]|uniref:hypothetical protein n=1 Tax=Streptomyces sp. NBC_01381 TaxID=2903845 RepID=UPI00224CC6F6|nr:hypothetical protein [Streptomyces sp. NBC_01381]MCX4668356.1 hypothetical protein [Streptomyces sp. NBC_01381]
MALTAMRVGPGDTVLINAAAGELGTPAAQLARAGDAQRDVGTGHGRGKVVLTHRSAAG